MATLDTSSTQRRWYRAALWLHRWTGLLATPFFLLLCISGSVLIFHEEIDEAFAAMPTAPRAGQGRALPLQALADRAMPPEHHAVYVDLAKRNEGIVTFGVAPAGTGRSADTLPVQVNAWTGTAAPMRDPRETVTGFLLELHAEWFAGLPGRLFGGLVALLTLVALVTGVVVHAPHVRRLALGAIRRERGARVVQLDWHNFLGIITLGWALVVTATGVLLAMASLLLVLWQATELKAMTAVSPGTPALARAVPIDAAIAAAAVARPDRRATFAFFPGAEYAGPHHYTVILYGREPYNQRLFDIAAVNAATGKVDAIRPLPLYLSAVALSEPLHFGDYGGLLLKLFWLANAWGVLWITGNGAWLWWAKRRRVRRDMQLVSA